MDELYAKRLATAITALMARFKVSPENSPYEHLSLTDAAVISCLRQAAAEGREPIQREVAASLRLPKTTMTSAVKRLNGRGLLKQGSGASDARSKTLLLTPDGQELGSGLEEAQIQASMDILRRLSARDQARLIELLERVVAQSTT